MVIGVGDRDFGCRYDEISDVWSGDWVMVQAIPARQLTLYDLSDRFGLERTDDDQFFQEWQTDLPELTVVEKQALDELKAEYQHLSKYPLLEPVIKMVVLSPLLKLARFYQPPFYLAAEKEVTITSEDEGIVIQGRIDLLVFHPPFWITVIESKQSAYSIEAGIPQALAYMLGNPDTDKPVLGFVTNGAEFRFLKMMPQPTPRYEQSDLFAIDSRDDVYQVLRILKRFAGLIRS